MREHFLILFMSFVVKGYVSFLAPMKTSLRRGSNIKDKFVLSAAAFSAVSSPNVDNTTIPSQLFMTAALSFDSYTPPSTLPASRRLETSPTGLSVTFVDIPFTSEVYKGLLAVTVKEVRDIIPREVKTTEKLLSGSGVDCYLLAGVVEQSAASLDSKTSDGDIISSLKSLLEGGGNRGSRDGNSDIDILTSTFSNGVKDLKSSVHVGRSSTAWSNKGLNRLADDFDSDGGDNNEKVLSSTSNSKTRYIGETSTFGFNRKGAKARWIQEAPFYLYVTNPGDASVLFSIMDEELLGQDVCIGSGVVKLSSVFNFDVGVQEKEKARGEHHSIKVTLRLTSKPPAKSKRGQILAGATAGAALGFGLPGAIIGGFAASQYEDRNVRGECDVELKYVPIASSVELEAQRKKHEIRSCLDTIDWAKCMGNDDDDDDDDDEDDMYPDLHLLTVISHQKTGCSCRVYRSLIEKKIFVAFRGTTLDDVLDPKDLLTDSNILQSPFLCGEDGDELKKDEVKKLQGQVTTDRDTLLANARVHSGFKNSLKSISRRLKELIVMAGGGDFEHYSVILTGHSLGGALATMFAADVGNFGFDYTRGMPSMYDLDLFEGHVPRPIVDQMRDAIRGTVFGNGNGNGAGISNKKVDGGKGKVDWRARPPVPGGIELYSFGSPRVGNKAFAKLCEKNTASNIKGSYRVVNDADIITRTPFSLTRMLGNIEYVNAGKTILIKEVSDEQTSNIRGEKMNAKKETRFFENIEEIEIARKVANGEAVLNHFEDSYFRALLSKKKTREKVKEKKK